MIKYLLLITVLVICPAVAASAADPSPTAPVEARALGPETLDGLWTADIERTGSLLGAEQAKALAPHAGACLAFDLAGGRCRAWTDASRKELLLTHPLEVVGMENDTVTLRVEGRRVLAIEIVDNDTLILRGRGVFSRIKAGEE